MASRPSKPESKTTGRRSLPRTEIRSAPAWQRWLASTGLVAASVSLAFWLYSRPAGRLTAGESFVDQWVGLTCLGPFQDTLPVLRIGREDPLREDIAERAAHEWRCIEAILAGGASAVGVMVPARPSRLDWALSEKWMAARRAPSPGLHAEKVIFFPAQGSFLRTLPKMQIQAPVAYPTAPDRQTFIAQLLQVAEIRTLREWVPVKLGAKPEAADITLANFSFPATPTASATLPSFRGKIVMLAASREVTAWREWQALQAVSREKVSRPRPSGSTGLLCTLAGWLLPPCLVFLPRQRRRRWLGWAMTPFLLLSLWLVLVFAAKLSPLTAPALLSWLAAGSLAFVLAIGSAGLHRLTPSPACRLARELVQGTRWMPVPVCWRRPLFRRPLPRLLPVQRKAAELLAAGIHGRTQLPSWLDRVLAQMDAVSAVRFWTELRR